VDILEYRGPIETSLKHLHSDLGGASMPSAWRVIIMRNHTPNLLLGYATSADVILAQLV